MKRMKTAVGGRRERGLSGAAGANRTSEGGGAAPLVAHLLGPARIAVGERQIGEEAWPRRSARALLLLLLATPGHRLPRDRALDLLWPEAAPAAALNALYVALHGLRRVLEPDLKAGRGSAYVETSGEMIGLKAGPGWWVDADVFEGLLARAAGAAPAARGELLREALALYGGDLLADEAAADWAAGRRERLRQGRRRAGLALAGLEEGAGRPLAAVTELERLVEGDATDEEVVRALMRALVAGGRRDDALRRYERCVRALREEFGAEPGEETRALAGEVRSAVMPRPALPAGRAPRFDNLPAAPTPLVGRSRELEAIDDLLVDPAVRLVTLTGTGGIGKTRLALEAARQGAEGFEDGVCFVSLAPVRDAALVAPTVAGTLGVEEAAGRPIGEAVIEALRPRELLLVLDNVEQVLDAAPWVAEALAACPRLTVLATSREPLHLRAEHELPVPPLTVPPARSGGVGGGITAAAAARYEAVSLFAQRVRSVNPTFALADGNAGTVAALCARLDGLPLAIELAAARGRRLAPEELLAGLDDRFALLAEGYRDLPARQRAMRDAIGWSYDLLDDGERALFRRLAVFVGGWTLEAAEAVAGAPSAEGRGPSGRAGSGLGAGDSARELLEGLVEKSLVRKEVGAEPRFGMLETIREFGLEALVASGEEPAARAAHVGFFLALAEEAEPELTGPEQATWLDRLEAEHANLRGAFDWASGHGEVEVALRMGAALWRFWSARGYLGEGRERLARALETGSEAPLPVRAAAMVAAGELAGEHGDPEAALALHEAALAAWRSLGDRPRLARALVSLGNVVQDRGEYERAASLQEQALELYRELDDRWGMAVSLNNLGVVAYYRGELDRAEAHWSETLSAMRELGDFRAMANALNNLGAIALQRGDLTLATARHEESLALRRWLGNVQGIASSLLNLGGVAEQAGDLGRAAALLAEALGLLREIGDDRSVAVALNNLGRTAHALGEAERALAALRESAATFHRLGDLFGVASALEGLAAVLSVRSEPEAAARIFAAAAALRERTGTPREASDQPVYDRHLAATRSALGDDAFGVAWEAGAAMPPERAVAEALEAASGTD